MLKNIQGYVFVDKFGTIYIEASNVRKYAADSTEIIKQIEQYWQDHVATYKFSYFALILSKLLQAA